MASTASLNASVRLVSVTPAILPPRRPPDNGGHGPGSAAPAPGRRVPGERRAATGPAGAHRTRLVPPGAPGVVHRARGRRAGVGDRGLLGAWGLGPGCRPR